MLLCINGSFWKKNSNQPDDTNQAKVRIPAKLKNSLLSYFYMSFNSADMQASDNLKCWL